MLEPAEARHQLLGLLREKALLRGDFVLSSGARSDYYLDARLVTLSGEGSALVGTVLLEAMRDMTVDAVAGLAIGADPVVSAIACVSGLQGKPIDALIVRKERKEHGAGRRIEGPWRDGIRVAVVDDAFTTGASALEAAAAVADAGGTVAAVYALIDREQGARASIEEAGYPFIAVYTGAEILSS